LTVPEWNEAGIDEKIWRFDNEAHHGRHDTRIFISVSGTGFQVTQEHFAEKK